MSTKPFLTAHWKNLVFFNYEVNPEILTPYLPAGTEPDFWNGKCLVSLVGFLFLDTRVKGWSFPFHQNFEEFNLRFYVKFNDASQWKRGVVFVKEIVPKRMITAIARLLYGEQYYCYPMMHHLKENETSADIKYGFFFNKEWNYIQVNTGRKSFSLVEDSEEAFIIEHYWGYTRHTATQTSEYRVEHPRWNILPVKAHSMHCNIRQLYGEVFVPYFRQPSSVFVAEGSPVKVYHRKLWRF